MHDAVDIIGRLRAAALRRRAPLWLGMALPWAVAAPFMMSIWVLAGLALALAWAAWDFQRLLARVARGWVAWLDGSVPALEDSTALLAGATSPVGQLQRKRLLERAAHALTPDILGRIARDRVTVDYRWLGVSVLLVLALFGWQHVRARQPAHLDAAAVRAVIERELSVRVTPPAYTGIKRYESAPRELQVPEHSLVEWCLKALPADAKPGAALALELSDGQSLRIGKECARWKASESVFWRWRGVRYNLKVTPDQAPQITVTTPRDMVQVLAQNATSASIALAVRDDYLIKRATLHLTLARGSGENIRFSDREMPIPESKDPRKRSWSRQWTLAELGMEPGDELYFFVRASDNAEQPHTSVSPTYTLRLPGPAEESDESSAVPVLVKPENLRSQRQVIIDTEQLVADMKVKGGLDAAAVRARSESIAGDQAQLRRRYGQFLGEESSLFGGDDHDTHEGSGEKHDLVAEFGHMHDQAENATLFDEATKKVLRRALSAMWDAEKSLRALTPNSALPPEYKALEAIKQLQQADRIYLHKTAFAPPPIKEELRMTGDVVGATSYKREQGAADEPIPAEVRQLIEALDADGALPALWSRTAQDWIRARISQDDKRLEAQRAVQDVSDGCLPCRPVLRAWLRGAINQAPVLLQAQGRSDTPFSRAVNKGVSR